MTRKLLSLLFSLLSISSIYGQKAIKFAQSRVEIFNVDATQTVPLKLSDIAEKVTAIPLNKNISVIQGAFWTEEYLFIASLRDIWQYDASGKFIKVIPCDGKTISGITGNLNKKELYIPVNVSNKKHEIWSYDYSGRIKKKIALKKPSVVNLLFHNDTLWVLSEKWTEKSTYGYYSYVNISTGKETFLPDSIESPAKKSSSGGYYRHSFVGTLSASSDCLYANWGNNVIWRIKNKKVEQAYKCQVNQKYKDEIICLKGVIGNYIFFNYHLDDNGGNLYLRHLKTGKTFNVKYNGSYGNYTQGPVEDVYQSGFFDFAKAPLTQEGYFWFIKNMHGKSLKGKIVKGNLVAFIVKTKQ